MVQLEDLVLHDAGMDARVPTHELVRAHTVLLARRRIVDHEPGWAITVAGLAALRGARATVTSDWLQDAEIHDIDDDDHLELGFERDRDETNIAGEFTEIDELLARTGAKTIATVNVTRDDSGLIYDDAWNEEARLFEWRKRLAEGETLPALMAAGVALDAWETIEPLQHRAWVGPLLAAELLRARGKTRHHLVAMHAGLRGVRHSRTRTRDVTSRVIDLWVDRNLPSVRFCRYADDAVIHCKSQAQAQFVLRRIDERFRQCGLELHPSKTRIVYCKDINRRQDHPAIEFTFLGYTFRPRKAVDKYGRVYVNFSPAVSRPACKAMRQTIRGWHLQLKCDKELADLATMFDPILTGWQQYYGRFYGSAMSTVWKHVNAYLVRWLMRKYKSLARHKVRAWRALGRLAQQFPRAFVHWRSGFAPMAG